MTVGRAINCTSRANTAVSPAVKPLVFANFLAPNMSSVYAGIAERVGRSLKVPAQLIEGSSFEQLRDGSAGVAFLCGLPYVRLCAERPGMLRPLAAPVLDEARYQDRPVYFSDVIVGRDSPFRSFDDLRGHSWAYNEAGSFSGCLLVRHHLLQMGETESFFGRVTFTGRHQESIRKVVDGAVDAAAIDSHVLGVELLRNPEPASQVRVIPSFGPSTLPLVVGTADIPATVQARIGAALCELGGDPESRRLLASGLIRRFTPIEDRAYDDIRQKLAAVDQRRAPFPPPRHAPTSPADRTRPLPPAQRIPPPPPPPPACLIR